MNQVELIGRLTRDPAVSHASSGTTVARFTLAIDRGSDKGTDYPSVIAFGSTAESVGKYLSKGSLAGVTGRIQTGSYDKDGQKVYTTDVYASRVEFLSFKQRKEDDGDQQYAALNEEVPF